MRPSFLLALCVGALSSLACAQSSACPPSPLDLDLAELRAATVIVSQAPFTDERGRADGRSVVRGDVVLQGPADRGRRCSYFLSPEGPVTNAYLKDAHVQALPSPFTLAGRWRRDEDAHLDLQSGGQLTGNVTSRGLATPQVGNVNGTLQKQGNIWTYAKDGCQLTLRPVGPWLLVTDNLACGGDQVTFRGLYRRQR
ncbi:hypothetical protein [Deinococcus hohokamensis]|uniref:Lipoprotein n=1 Tax=Deinococcus hohokamensis TaxID=309883 RepID=A0ABV9IAK2_9DEIO